MKAAIEGLLFVKGSDGLTISEICNVLEANPEEVKNAIKELYQDYQSE